MSTKEETKKGGVTMRGKYQNQDTNDPRKIPAEYLDENGNWNRQSGRSIRKRNNQIIANEVGIFSDFFSLHLFFLQKSDDYPKSFLIFAPKKLAQR